MGAFIQGTTIPPIWRASNQGPTILPNWGARGVRSGEKSAGNY